jgi:hypothetical protein
MRETRAHSCDTRSGAADKLKEAIQAAAAAAAQSHAS